MLFSRERALALDVPADARDIYPLLRRTPAVGVTAPDTTAPDTTAPDTTAPDTTAPYPTAPHPTAPGTAAPDAPVAGVPRGVVPPQPRRRSPFSAGETVAAVAL